MRRTSPAVTAPPTVAVSTLLADPEVSVNSAALSVPSVTLTAHPSSEDWLNACPKQ